MGNSPFTRTVIYHFIYIHIFKHIYLFIYYSFIISPGTGQYKPLDLFLKIVLDILGPSFPINFRVSLSISTHTKYYWGFYCDCFESLGQLKEN